MQSIALIIADPRRTRLELNSGTRRMKYEEAKQLIVLEWDRWVQTQTINPGGASGRETLKFFHKLQDTRPWLLDFQSKGRDKWRLVHAWLLSEHRVVGEIGGQRYTPAAGKPTSVRSWIDSDDPVRRDRVYRSKAESAGQPLRRSDPPRTKLPTRSHPRVPSPRRTR